MDGRPIANKYREGKMKRTLKRELKVLEIVEGEGIGSRRCTQADVGNLSATGTECRPTSIVRGGRRAGFASGLCLPVDRGTIRALFEPFGSCALWMLAEGFRSARLETRTKESNMYASRWAVDPRGASNLTGGKALACTINRP